MSHRAIFIVAVGEVFEGAINMQGPVYLKGEKEIERFALFIFGVMAIGWA
ncbi:hypothetical protein [Photobacterium frigidiphilum]|nr:hypothetical protein [Photobacterium frigidiphilum]